MVRLFTLFFFFFSLSAVHAQSISLKETSINSQAEDRPPPTENLPSENETLPVKSKASDSKNQIPAPSSQENPKTTVENPSDSISPSPQRTKIQDSYLTELSENNLYARFITSLGPFVARLWGRQAPQGVANFMGLAMGTRVFTDLSGKRVRRPFYDGLIFHKVSGKSTIHTGCPFGNGRGGPGYHIQDELENGLNFDTPYQLAYGNYGPNTNGSQIFINVIPRPDLNNGYTIFGTVVEGEDVINKIATAQTNAREKPTTPIILEKVEIFKKDNSSR